MSRRLVFALFVLIFFSVSASIVPSAVEGYYTNMPASVVVGQANFTDNSLHLTQNGLNVPDSIIVVNNKLIVADQQNDRVLIWNSVPTQNNTPADVVLGQPNFTSDTDNNGGISAKSMLKPSGLASDGQKLLVADRNNHRILIYNSVPTTNFASADVVIGQQDFVHDSVAIPPAANTLRLPDGIFFDGQKLFISDSDNNRVLIFNSIPTANNASANLVLGQPDFVSRTANNGGISAQSMYYPHGIVSNGSKLVVAEELNHRVLIWNSIPTTNRVAADVVIGQSNFSSGNADQGGSVGGNTLNNPGGDLTLLNNRLFLPDSVNSRLLIFNTLPTSNNVSADVVLGQPNFTSNTANNGGIGANTFNVSSTSYVFNNKLYVLDAGNNRLLIFSNVIATPKLNMDTPPTDIGNGWLRVKGNILLGERERYKMQWVKASVNGEGYSNVTYLDGGRDDGPGETRYEWYHDFTLPSDKRSEYTLKILASSFNADESSLFFFSPFKFLSFSDGNTQTLKLSVPKTHIQSVKDNVDHFELWSRGFDDGWKVYAPNIPTSLINTTTGEVTYSFTKTIGGGSTDFKIVSVSKDSNWRFDSNTLTQTISGSRISGLNLTSSSSSPLQLNNVGGSIVSTFNLSGVREKYTLSSTTPIFKGIAYASSKVTMLVTNNTTGEERTYSVKVSPDSTFTISPILFPNSTITVYLVDPLGRFAVLPSFGVGF